MKRSSVLVLAPLLFLVGRASAQTAPPHLEHSAPWLGQTLELTVTGAPAITGVRLLHSPARDQMPTPFGMLELERATTNVVAVGATDAGGQVTFELAIPLDPALAESEAHYQALVTDDAAPGGRVLSEAAHLRLVGPRMYAGSRGLIAAQPGGPREGGLAILSAVSREVVATVDYGVPATGWPPMPDAQPVFRADLSRGAVVSPNDELLLFDPFFGDVLASIPFERPASALATDPGGMLLYVLETGLSAGGDPLKNAVLHALDLATGASLSSLQLPRSAAGLWCPNADGSEVYVVEIESAQGPSFVRRITLPGLQDLGAIEVGFGAPHVVRDIAWGGPHLFVATFDPQSCNPDDVSGTVTRVDYATAPPRVVVDHVTTRPGALTPERVRDMLFSFHAWYCMLPGGKLEVRRLSGPGPATSVGLPPLYSDGFVEDLAGDGDVLWGAIPLTYDGHAALMWLDLDDFAWTELPMGAGTSGPIGVEVVRDALEHVGCVIIQGLTAGNLEIDALAVFVEPGSGAQTEVPIRRGPESLLAVELP